MQTKGREPRKADLDIVVHGATSYVGRLVAEHLLRQGAPGNQLKWALAGRDYKKLCALRDEIGAANDLPIMVTDLDSEPSLQAMARQTRAVITTVGPYQLYGTPLLKACVSEGVDYLNLCAEPIWMRQMIDQFGERASETGSRIVFSCGFASVPSELGVLRLQEMAQAAFGRPFSKVSCYVRKFKGGLSSGTAASLGGTEITLKGNPQLAAVVRDPFYLSPGFEGPKTLQKSGSVFDELVGVQTVPFFLGAVDVANVHRSNLLQNFAYGTQFMYEEFLVASQSCASSDCISINIQGPPSATSPHNPGVGPTKNERESGLYDLLFVGSGIDKGQLRISVSGRSDPGYSSTSVFIAETAICMLEDPRLIGGGIWTPSAALGNDLVAALQKTDVLSIEIEENE